MNTRNELREAAYRIAAEFFNADELAGRAPIIEKHIRPLLEKRDAHILEGNKLLVEVCDLMDRCMPERKAAHEALDEIIAVLGPEADCEGCCEGCRAEIYEALKTALSAREKP